MALPTSAQEVLTTFEYRVVGTELRVSPEAPAFPKGIPGSVLVEIVAGAGDEADAGAALAEGARVEATLRGPSFPARRVVGLPNEPLLLPPLPLVGDYRLDGVRLVDASSGEVRLEGRPSSVAIRVFEEVLVSRVASRPLALEEIQEKGIVIDERSFRAVEFEVGFVVDGETVPVRFPVVAPRFTEATEVIPQAELEAALAQAEAINGELAQAAELPPELESARLQIEIQPINLQFVDPGGDPDLALRVPPIPALLVIPGNIGFLNQFFSVQLFTENAAPAGSGLSVHGIEAALELPPGDVLRFARVGPDDVVEPVQAVVSPGFDGEVGTADDVGRLRPGETGQAEFLVEGLKEGLHVLDVAIEAKLDGLVAGTVEIRGRASGSVLVRNPNFSLAFSHPRTVRAGEPYRAAVTILNTSPTPANLVRVTLPETSLSGAVFEAGQEETLDLGTLAPGETATAEYRLRAQRTGSISFSQLTGDKSIVGRFRLRLGVDEREVPLSPDAIGYPDFAEDLASAAPGVFAAADRVLGQALSVATAPRLPAGVRGLPRSLITQRVVELAEAGQRLRYGDPLARVLADLLLDWQGARRESEGFDQILRETGAGREWREAVALALEADGLASANDRLLARAADLAGRGEPWQIAAVDRASIELAYRAGDEEATLDASRVGRATGYRGSEGHWLVARPEEGAAWRWEPSGSPGPAELILLSLAGDGTGRLLRWSLPAVDPGSCLFHVPGDANRALEVDDDCDGSPESSVVAAETPVVELAPAAIAAIQDLGVNAGRPRQTCLGPASYRNYGTVVAVLFSKPMDQAGVDLPGSYVLDGGNAASSVQIQPGGRVALLNLARGVGTLRPRSLSLAGLADPRGNPLPETALPLQTTAEQGMAVDGRVARANGEPAAGVPVTLTMHDSFQTALECVDVNVRASQVFSDGEGRFSFDFVLAGVPYSLSATDTVGLSDEALAVIAEAATDGAFERATLLELASRPDTEDTLLEQFALGALPDFVALAEGLDRALRRDFVDLGSPRIGTELPVALRFRGRGSVAGRVVAADGSTPVPAVAVNLFPDPGSRELGRGVLSDFDGRFAFFGVPLGSYTLEATTGGELGRVVSGAIGTPGEADELEIVLSASAVERTALRGRVLEGDLATGHPSARVFVGRYVGGSFGGVVAAVDADAEGFFEVRDIPVGAWDLVALSFDGKRVGERRDVAASAGATGRVNLVLQGRATVVGRVEFADGRPAPHALVAGGEALVRADANGAFRLEGVPTGRRTLRAGLERDPAAGIDFPRLGSVELEVAPGVESFAVVRLAPRGRIVGTVRDAAGQPVPGVNVAIPRPSDGAFLWTRADENGSYRFENLALGDYTVSAPAPPVADTDVSDILDTLAGFADEEGEGADAPVEDFDLDIESDSELLAAIGEAFEIFTGVNDPLLTGEGLAFNPLSWGFARTGLDFDGQTRVVNVQFLPVGTLSGSVLNGQGVPIGARVRLTGIGPSKLGDVATIVRGERNSDPALGSFSFEGQALAGDWGLQAASPFYPTVISLSGRTTPVDPDASGIVLQFPPQQETLGRLAGRVLALDGSPAGPGVAVRISFGDLEIETDEAGRFDAQIDLPAANASGARISYAVEAEDAGGLRGRSVATLSPGETTEVTVRLLGRGGLVVRVNGADGQPAGGAQVRVQQGSFPRDAFEGTTSASGELTLANLFAGPYALEARLASGPTTISGRAAARVEAGRTAAASVTLEPTATLRGRFVERDLTTPVPFAQISIGMLGFASTDEQGDFEVSGIPLDDYRVVAEDPVNGRLATANVSLTRDGEIREILLAERSLGEIAGGVLSGFGSAFVPGASVTLTLSDGVSPPRTVTTDPSGFFSFPAVPAGAFVLSALDPPTGLRGAVSAVLPEDAERVEIDVPLQPLAHVAVQVWAPDGAAPASNAAATLEGGTTELSLDTGVDGRASFSAVPLGRYTLRAVSRQPGSLRSAAARSFELDAQGATREIDLTLRGVGSLTGVLLASDAITPLAGREVRLFVDAPLVRDTESLLTDAAGRFAFADVAVGSYRLTARDGALAASVSGEIASDGESQEVELVLSESGTVRGRLVEADGVTAVEGVDVALSFAPPSGLLGVAVVQTDAAGFFEASEIPVGDFALEAIAAEVGGIARLEAALAANGELLDLGDVILDQASPSVEHAVPEPNRDDVPIDAIVTLRFDEPLDASRFDPAGVLLRTQAGPVPADVALLPDPLSGALRVVEIRPVAALESEVRYEAVVLNGELRDALGSVVAEGPVDLAGRPLLAPFVLPFTTADQDPPELLSLTPADGAIQVDPSAVIRLSFDEPLREEGLQLALEEAQGTPVAGDLAVGLDGRVVVFTPAIPLEPNASYRAKADGLADAAGNPVAGQPITTDFSTLDTLGPEIASLFIRGGSVPEAGSTLEIEAVLVAPEAGASVRMSADLVVFGQSAPGDLALPLTLPDAPSVVIRAVAIDRFGNEGPLATLPIDVVPDEPPMVVFRRVAPTSGPVPSGSELLVIVEAEDTGGLRELRTAATGIASLPLTVNDGTSIPIALDIPASAGPGAVVTVFGEAIDTAGQSSGEQRLEIPVNDGVAPSVAIRTPLAGAEVENGAPLLVEVAAADAFGVSELVLEVAGALSDRRTLPIEPAGSGVERSFAIDVPADLDGGDEIVLIASARDEAGFVSGPFEIAVRTPDRRPPRVIEASPADGATGVGPGALLEVRLSEPVAAASLAAGAVRLGDAGGSEIPLALGLVEGGRVLRIAPQLPLAMGADHTLEVGPPLADAAGNTLVPFASAFATGGIRFLTPTAGERFVEVAPLAVELEVDPGLALDRLELALDDRPEAALSSEPFEATLATPALVDLAGGVLSVSAEALAPAEPGADDVLAFTTGAGSDLDPTAALDAADGAFVALGGGSIALRFAETIVDGAGDDLRVDEVGDDEAAQVFASENGVDWSVLGEAAGTTSFDLAGAGLAAARFVRIDDLGSAGPGAAGFDLDAVEALSTAPGTLGTAQVAVEVVGAGDDSDGDGIPNGAERDLGLDPFRDDAGEDPDEDGRSNLEEFLTGTQPFDADSDDDGLDDGAEALLGTDPLDADSDDDGIPDGEDPAPTSAAPSVIALDPADGAADVGLATAVTIELSPALAPATVNAQTVQLAPEGGAALASQIALSADGRVVTLLPAEPLLPATLYRLTLTTGIESASGGALAEELSASFTTGAFSITRPRDGEPVPERSEIALEARASATAGIASVVFSVDGSELPAVPGASLFQQSFTTPAASAAPTLSIVASGRDAGGFEIARDDITLSVAPELRFVPRLLGVPLGAERTALLQISSPPAQDLEVALAAVDAGVVGLASDSVSFPAGETQIEVALSGEAEGASSVVASLGSERTAVIVSVQPAGAGRTIRATAPPVGLRALPVPRLAKAWIAPGATTPTGARLLEAPVAVDTSFSVSSSAPAVADVDAPVTVPAGSRDASFALVGGAPGGAVLTLFDGTRAFEIEVVVGTPEAGAVVLPRAGAVGLDVPPPPRLAKAIVAAGSVTRLSVSLLAAPAASDTPVSVRSSDPAVADVPGAVTIPAGETTATFELASGSDGTATLELSTGAAGGQIDVIVGVPLPGEVAPTLAGPVGVRALPVPPAGKAFLPVGESVELTALLLPTPAATGTSFSIESSDPGVAAVAGPVTVAAGERQASFVVVAGVEGVATLTLRDGDVAAQLQLVVGVPPVGSIAPVVASPASVRVEESP